MAARFAAFKDEELVLLRRALASRHDALEKPALKNTRWFDPSAVEEREALLALQREIQEVEQKRAFWEEA